MSSSDINPSNPEEEKHPEVRLEDLKTNSRYAHDFEELSKIGEGGFGQVFRARHKLDGHIYAIKKIKLSNTKPEENRRIKREVTYQADLQSPYIVRYF